MSVVGGLFSDVFKPHGMAIPGAAGTVDWSKAGGIPADLNWEAIKPFQVMPPMSWAATNKGATAPEEAKKQLDSIASTDTRSEYQKWLDIQNKSSSGGSGADRTGGLAGNGTNFTDDQWESIKTMNDQYGFFGNPVNKIGLGALAQLMAPAAVSLFGLNNENPFTAQQRSVDAINAWRDGLAMDGGVPISVETPTAAVGGYSSMPSQSPNQNTEAQNAAMATSLNNAGYYTPSYSPSVGDGSDGRSYGISGGEGE